MSKFENVCELLKSESGPVYVGIAAVALIFVAHCLTKNGYRVTVKTGETTVTVASTSAAAEEPDEESE